MTEWVLAGCVKGKADHRAPAQYLYTSPLFQKRRRAAEARGDGWGILSAEYGYVPPNEVIDPYDTHISDVDVEEWRQRALGYLPRVLEANDVTQVTILAGSKYVDPLVADLEALGVDVVDPCRGLRPGERQQKLEELARVAENNRLDAYGGGRA